MASDAYDVMDLKALRCFWAMAKHLSVTQASVELGISEAAISQRIKSLEKYLGTKLYEARGGRVRLTVAGERTMQMAISTFEGLEQFERSIARGEEATRITLCTTDTPLRYMLPKALLQFSTLHPFASLRLRARPVEQIVHMVRTNEADIGIVPEQRFPEELQFEAIGTFPGCVIFPRGHVLVGRARADFGTLLDANVMNRYPLIVSEVQIETGSLQRIFERLGVPLNVGIEVSTVDTLKHCVSLGLGIATLSALCLSDADFMQLDVVQVPSEIGAHTTYGMLSRRDKHSTAPLASLVSLIRACGTKPPSREDRV